MNNHFHLIVETPLANLSEFMRHFNITYTAYFNKRHKRSGHLYQGRYKSILVDSDGYIVQLSRYIHLNPIQIKKFKDKTQEETIKFLKQYRWSSLCGYCFDGKQEKFVDYGMILKIFGGESNRVRKTYWKDICSDVKNQTAFNFPIVGQSILGSDDFVEKIKMKLDVKENREVKDIKFITTYKKKDQILKIVERIFGKNFEEILKERGFERYVAMDLLYRYGGLKGPQIGAIFGIDYSTVSVARRRLREQCKKNAEKMKILKAVENECM